MAGEVLLCWHDQHFGIYARVESGIHASIARENPPLTLAEIHHNRAIHRSIGLVAIINRIQRALIAKFRIGAIALDKPQQAFLIRRPAAVGNRRISLGRYLLNL